MSMYTVRARLPQDRTKLGTLTLQTDSGKVWGPVPCLGKSDNDGARRHGNPHRDPLLPYGDHPLGQYRITALVSTGDIPEEIQKYGPAGKLVLDPTAGQALKAKQAGRYGLLIHGGDQGGPYQGYRPTYGCLRLSNEDMQALADLYLSLKDPRTNTYLIDYYVAERSEP